MSRPDASSMRQLHAALREYLQMEGKFQPQLCLKPDNEPQSSEVSTGARDGAAHVLRCLKVWYDLPVDVFIYAVNLFDRFLTKMKVRPCHVPCITVSCMNIAIESAARDSNMRRQVSLEELVSVSQSACTAGDVRRMSAVIVDKLSLARGAAPVTAAHWLRAFAALVGAHAPPEIALQEGSLLNLLEIVICDYRCANARTSELALVLLYCKLEEQLLSWSRRAQDTGTPPVSEAAYSLFDIAPDLQAFCNMSDASLFATGQLVRAALARYEARAAAPQRQRLVWRLSERTLKVLRPTDRLTSLLPTIEEQQGGGGGGGGGPAPQDATPGRNRSGSESSESEETSGWPRSPVLPVYCDN